MHRKGSPSFLPWKRLSCPPFACFPRQPPSSDRPAALVACLTSSHCSLASALSPRRPLQTSTSLLEILGGSLLPNLCSRFPFWASSHQHKGCFGRICLQLVKAVEMREDWAGRDLWGHRVQPFLRWGKGGPRWILSCRKFTNTETASVTMIILRCKFHCHLSQTLKLSTLCQEAVVKAKSIRVMNNMI